MDNITHSLVGVGLAELAMSSRATKAQRPLLVGAGVIAANLPDIDLAYSIITPSPVGYLLHHRGHTHTIAGLVLLGLALASTYWASKSVRKMHISGLLRFWSLIAVALASHLALDALNNYGVHPFYPVDNAWRYGDAVFIFEPWLWLLLGVAVAWNGRTRMARLAAALPLVIVLCAIASTGIVPLESVAALAVVGGAFAWVSRGRSPGARMAAAFALCGLLIAALIGTSRTARGAVAEALAPELHGPLVDLVLTPNPASPLCWGAIAIEMRESASEYVLWKGTLSLAPAWRAPTTCASHWFDQAREVRTIGGRLTLERIVHQPLPRLRALAEQDCWVRAWLRFGRAPVIEDGWIYDLRYGERQGRSFSHLRLEPRDGCPTHVPPWSMPRADLLAGLSAVARGAQASFGETRRSLGEGGKISTTSR